MDGERPLSTALLAVVLLGALSFSNAHGARGKSLVDRLRDTTIDAPRCDTVDLMLRPLRASIWQRGDRVLSWQGFCDYGTGKKPKARPNRKRR